VAHGRVEEAHRRHSDALAVATEIGDPYEQARAHHGIAAAHHAAGQTDHARRHWQHALALYADLDVPDTDAVRVHLSALKHT
jgi:hypothetical protein